MEQKLQTLFDDKVRRFNLCMYMCENTLHPEDDTFEAYYMTNKLSRENKLELTRNEDAYSDFRCFLLPGQKIKSASLYMTVQVPKDPDLLKSYLDSYCKDLPTEDLLKSYCKDLSTKGGCLREMTDVHYVLVKKIDIVDSSTFNFFNCPLYYYHPCTSLSIQVELDKVGLENPNCELPVRIVYKAYKIPGNKRDMMLTIGSCR